MTLSSREKTLFQKIIPWWHLFYTSRTFARIRQHYSSKYSGDGCMGRPQTQILGGLCPVSPRSPPMGWMDEWHTPWNLDPLKCINIFYFIPPHHPFNLNSQLLQHLLLTPPLFIHPMIKKIVVWRTRLWRIELWQIGLGLVKRQWQKGGALVFRWLLCSVVHCLSCLRNSCSAESAGSSLGSGTRCAATLSTTSKSFAQNYPLYGRVKTSELCAA